MDFRFLDRLLNAVLVFDDSYNLLYHNQAATHLIGLSEDQIEDAVLINNYFTFEDPNIFSKTLSVESRSYETKYREIDYKTSSGKVGVANIKLYNIESSKQWLIEIEDITSEVNLRKQLISRSKLASLGEVSAGIAHELNNPLTSIIGFSQIIKDNIVSGSSLENSLPMLEKIKDASRRMVTVINNLRQFSQGVTKKDWMQVDVNVPIKNSIAYWAEYMAKREIDVTYHVENDIPAIWGDPELLENVFQNLMTNSKDAFEKLFDGRENTIDIIVKKKGDSVEIIYTDNAGGMSDEVKKHLFDPFFTTKEARSGAGLGMSLLHKIVQEHCGSICVTTDLGVGTTFRIVFPKDRRKNQRSQVAEDTLSNQVDKNLPKPTILVIDDEEEICEIVESYLSAIGDIVVFTDPKRAVELIKERSFDLILTDLKMPEVTGMDVLSVTKQYRPESPVVFISGHARADVEIKNALSAGALDVITKPFLDKGEFVHRICGYLE